MKNLLIPWFVLSAFLLTGCDDKFQLSKLSPPKDEISIAEMISTGKEKNAHECRKGSVSLECEFLSLDLLGSDKWHHTKVYIYNSGKVEISVDSNGFSLRQTGKESNGGTVTTSYHFEGVRGYAANIKTFKSNERAGLTFDVFNSDGKRYAMGGTAL